eukprot:6190716-Pleurochrysis_carterae.AAC.4
MPCSFDMKYCAIISFYGRIFNEMSAKLSCYIISRPLYREEYFATTQLRAPGTAVLNIDVGTAVRRGTAFR